MKRKILLRVSSILICLGLLLPGTAAFAAETEVALPAYAGLFPPSASGRVSLMALSNESAIKADIKAALEAGSTEVDLQKYAVPVSEGTALYALFYDVLYENPGLFYVKTQIQAWSNGTILTKLDFSESYAYTDNATINRNRALIDAEVNTILSTIDPAMSDAEKALAVHDWFVLRYAYNVPASLTNELSAAHRIDGLFIDKTAVCQGYALGYIYVLSKLGIETKYVPSIAMGHAWNMVKIGNKWYHVDVTHDDPVFGGEDMFGYVSHENFLRSDTGITETGHFMWESPYTASSDYTNMFWEDITSGIFYANGKWYYKNENDIVSQTFTAASPTTVYTVSDRWTAGGSSYYMGLFGIGIFDGRIYYNTATEIRSINTSGQNNRGHGSPNLGGKQIYNMVLFGDMAYLGVGTDPNDTYTIQTMQLQPAGLSVTKTGNGFAISFPDAAESAGTCWLAWYDDGELLGMRPAAFNAGATEVTVSANVGVDADVKVFVWGASLAPLYKAGFVE